MQKKKIGPKVGLSYQEFDMVATITHPFSTTPHKAPASNTIRNHPTQLEELEIFNKLVLAHQDAVFRQAYWIMGEEEAAEDATQEAFLRAFQHMHAFNGGSFLPWILRITTNYCYDQLRRQKIRQTIPLQIIYKDDVELDEPSFLKDQNASVEETIEQSEMRTRIIQSIKCLSPQYRNAIILVDLQDMDYEEAALTLGIPIGTFKSRLSRARAQLQKWLLYECKPFLN